MLTVARKTRSARNFRVVAAALGCITVLVVTGAPPAGAALPPLDHSAMLAAMPGVVAAGAPSIVAYGIDESGVWSAASGTAVRKTGEPASPDAAFRIGSISKMFVAVAILQLVAQGKIDLDAPVNTYLPGLLTRGDDITIRELLQHRAGLASTGFGNGHGNTWFPDIKKSCRNDADPVAMIKQADQQLFEPGTAYNYANAGYTALGLVIQEVTGRSYEQALTDQILTPLGLSHTSFQEGVPNWPTPHVHGYGDYQPGKKIHKNLIDDTDCKTSFLGAAASGISTGRDLTTFITALTHGQLLPQSLYQQMIDTKPTGQGYEFGLGIVRANYCGVDLLGFSGAVYGYSTDLYTTADGTRTFADSMQIWPGTNDMWAAQWKVFGGEFCGVS